MAKNDERLGVAVIGLGVGEQHVRQYSKLKDCEVKWLCDFEIDKAQKLVSELGIGKVARSLDDIFQDPETNIVSIASYDNFHFEQTVNALNSNKHVFVEKPLCCSLGELKSIKKCWQEKKNLKLKSNLLLRSAMIYQWLKQQINSGVLGEIYAFDGDYLYGRLNKITEGWRKDLENYSVMLGGGVHLADLMIWLTEQKPTSVISSGSKICTKNTDFKYLDYVSSTFTFNSGLIGRINANFGCVHKHQHFVRVFGTKGTFIYDDKGPRLHTSRNSGVPSLNLDIPTIPFSKGDLIPFFVECVKNNTYLDTQSDFDVTSVCLSAQKSINEQKIVEVEYV